MDDSEENGEIKVECVPLVLATEQKLFYRAKIFMQNTSVRI